MRLAVAIVLLTGCAPAALRPPAATAIDARAHVRASPLDESDQARAGRWLVAGELCTDVNIEHPALDVICGVGALRASERVVAAVEPDATEASID